MSWLGVGKWVVSKGAFQFFVFESSMVKLISKSNFSLLSSFQVEFETEVNLNMIYWNLV